MTWPNKTIVEGAIANLLEELGYDEDDENFKDTPRRVRKFLETFQQKEIDPSEILSPIFPTQFDQMIMQKNINFVSLCAHHMLPFRGKAAVAYVPHTNENSPGVVGLSKLTRLVQQCARRLTLQEDVTFRIAEALQTVLRPKGVMVVLEASHDCMSIRGVEEPQAITVTSAVRGCFLDNTKGSKDEFLALLRG